jgi:hypothetical protein
MPTLQRRVSMRGPRFYREGDELMFVHHLDGSTQIGPRPATDEDRATHAEALAALEAEAPVGGARRARR